MSKIPLMAQPPKPPSKLRSKKKVLKMRKLPQPPIRVVREGCLSFCEICNSTNPRSGFLRLFGKRIYDNKECESHLMSPKIKKPKKEKGLLKGILIGLLIAIAINFIENVIVKFALIFAP